MKRTFSFALVGFAVAFVMLGPNRVFSQEEAPAAATEDRVSISFTEASIQDVLRSLASMREGVNIVVDPGLTGEVTCQLEDVPWETALKLVTDMHGLVVTRDSENIYRVSRPQAAIASDLTIELHTAESIARLTDEEALALAGDPSLGPEEARAFLADAPTRYVNRVIAENQPAVDIVTELARQASLNFAFSADFEVPVTQPGQPAAPAVLPPVSLNLRNIGLEDALLLIAEQGKLTIINRNGVWLVSPYRPEAVQLEPLKMETFTINYLPLDDELVAILQTLCTERGRVTKGKNKILIVRATADSIEAIRETLLVMDRPTPQVLIEARFFQAGDGFSKKLGIDWKDLGTVGGFTIDGTWEDLSMQEPNLGYLFSQADPGADPPVYSSPVGWAFGLNENNTAIWDELIPGSAQQRLDIKNFELDTIQYAYLSWPDVQIVLHAMEESNDVKQIANPKIICNSDEQATIHIGEQRPIIKSTIETGEGNNTIAYELDGDYGDEEISEVDLGGQDGPTQQRSYTTNKGYLDLGTKLTVLPSVKTEEEVYLRVVPELLSVRAENNFVISGGGDTGDTVTGVVSYPTLFRTYVRSQFTLKSGQTVAIGGLVSEDERKEVNGIPLLNRIPWLGKWLFSYESTSVVRSETIIFITVKVISGKELQTVAGVPIRSKSVQEEIDRIHEEDADGAEYNEDKAREALEAAEAAEDVRLENRVNNTVKRFFGFGKEEEVDAMEPPESYLEE